MIQEKLTHLFGPVVDRGRQEIEEDDTDERILKHLETASGIILTMVELGHERVKLFSENKCLMVGVWVSEVEVTYRRGLINKRVTVSDVFPIISNNEGMHVVKGGRLYQLSEVSGGKFGMKKDGLELSLRDFIPWVDSRTSLRAPIIDTCEKVCALLVPASKRFTVEQAHQVQEHLIKGLHNRGKCRVESMVIPFSGFSNNEDSDRKGVLWEIKNLTKETNGGGIDKSDLKARRVVARRLAEFLVAIKDTMILTAEAEG